MVDDWFDLSKVENGRIDLTFANVNLNELVQQCVGMMQPQANHARIIISQRAYVRIAARQSRRTGIAADHAQPAVKRDQVYGPGGQIIVSTVFSDAREATLRVRDHRRRHERKTDRRCA